jgi:hypothetical protein
MATGHYCQHDQCVGHKPQYQVLEIDIVPTHFLGISINLFERCCGRFMVIVKKVEHLACAVCGVRKTRDITGFAQCPCCGKLVDGWYGGLP